ncbi:MAG: glycosyltransferase [Sciscionella sp.]|nr:glycosyltransferase [Sciscionella sp.]
MGGNVATDARPEQPASAPASRPQVDSDDGQRLTAMRGLFRGPSDAVPDDLYALVHNGNAVRGRQSLALERHTDVSMNTYFGRFPASYWQRWTVIDEVTVEVTVSGTGRLSVGASDVHANNRVVATHSVDGARTDTVRLTAKIDKFLDGGALWLDAHTDDGELTVHRLRWTVAAPEKLRRSSVAICTYNRVDDVLNTLSSLSADPDALGYLDAIYVTDQGSDKVDANPRFADIATALGDTLHYLQQPNLGGAGGFGRGMYEVLGDDGSTDSNVLLMDDDVLLEPEIVIRLTAFANRTTRPTLVGGQMLKLLHPNYLLAGAEWADMDDFIPGRVCDGALDDADLLGVDEDGNRNLGERRIDADYNAWWSCLIPAEAINAIGYPLPLFFQWDDIEFGYRAKENGFNTVTLPGAGLWHLDFDWKDLDEWNRYFSIRNAMICAALHGRLDPVHTARVLLAQVVRNLLAMQYGLTATILRAAEDFLAGPAILHDGGTSVAAEIRKLRKEYPETITHPATDVPGYESNELPQVRRGSQPMTVRLTLIMRALRLALGKTRYDVGAVAYDEASWWHVSQFDAVAVTDASQQGVRLRRRDRQLTVALAKQAAKTLTRVVRETPAVKQRYRDALPELTSRANWTRLYGDR